ncbi:MAG: orotidine-5'-phosphate decarboxylase [Bacteroidota bacterium]
MTRSELVENIQEKSSFLCVGLDTDIQKIPKFLLEFEDPVFEFNKRIIDATKEHCVAYKPNIAFYECRGAEGWSSLEKTIDYIPTTHFTIADAKRGDIGNTSKMYAKTFFENMNFDSVTVAPYMGIDSVTPFLEFKEKWVILLGLTSNKGAIDYQFEKNERGEFLFETVIRRAKDWGTDENLMYVAGATRGEDLIKVREHAGTHFLLVPGVGAQGGSLEQVVKYAGIPNEIALLVNSSRGIIYASQDEHFESAAAEAAKKVADEMSALAF